MRCPYAQVNNIIDVMIQHPHEFFNNSDKIFVNPILFTTMNRNLAAGISNDKILLMEQLVIW
jgi:hypothetical protein